MAAGEPHDPFTDNDMLTIMLRRHVSKSVASSKIGSDVPSPHFQGLQQQCLQLQA